jgi:hypothetical protein
MLSTFKTRYIQVIGSLCFLVASGHPLFECPSHLEVLLTSNSSLSTQKLTMSAIQVKHGGHRLWETVSVGDWFDFCSEGAGDWADSVVGKIRYVKLGLILPDHSISYLNFPRVSMGTIWLDLAWPPTTRHWAWRGLKAKHWTGKIGLIHNLHDHMIFSENHLECYSTGYNW